MLGFAPVSALPVSAIPVEAAAPVVLKLAGYTRDRCGPVLPNCTVVLHQDSDDAPVASTTSDALGYYEFVDPAGGPFHLYSYDASGTLAGVTRRGIVAS